MRDRVPIFSGLFLFLVLFAYPVWHGIAAVSTTDEPELKLPVKEKACIASREFMRTAHMQLLIGWRDGFVREHRRSYLASNGATYKVSLTNTCLGQCHGSRKEFCDRCHSYAALPAPYCWDCHQDVSTASDTTAGAIPGRQP